MLAHGRVRLACELEQVADFRKDLASVLVIEDVRYRPRWSWEIEAVMEAASDDLPPDLSPSSADWLAGLRGFL